jgi:hypothetical protein
VEKPKRKNNLEDPGVGVRLIITMDLQELGWGMDWIDLAQDREGGGHL